MFSFSTPFSVFLNSNSLLLYFSNSLQLVLALAGFCDGNVELARALLLAKKGRNLDWSLFQLGVNAGICIVFIIWVTWDCLVDLTPHPLFWESSALVRRSSLYRIDAANSNVLLLQPLVSLPSPLSYPLSSLLPSLLSLTLSPLSYPLSCPIFSHHLFSSPLFSSALYSALSSLTLSSLALSSLALSYFANSSLALSSLTISSPSFLLPAHAAYTSYCV